MVKLKFIVSFVLFNSCFFILSNAQTGKKLKTVIVDAGHGGSDNGATGQYEGSLRSKEKDITLAISKKLVVTLQKALPDVNIVPTRTTDVFHNVNEKAKIANENKGDLFLCIHADSGPLKTARRQIGTREVTHYKTRYTGKGKKRKKVTTAKKVTEPVYQYYKLPMTRSGTSVWIFASHKTSDKLKAIVENEEDFNLLVDEGDSVENNIDLRSPEYAPIIAIYAKLFQEKSIKMGMLLEDEVAKSGRQTLGLNQRQVGIRVLQSTNMPAILIETGFINNVEDERYLNSDEGQQELAESITRAVLKYRDFIEGTNLANQKIQAAKVDVKDDDNAKYSNRTKHVLKKIELKEAGFKVDLYDDGDVDGDIVSVYYNGRALLTGKKLTEKALTLNLTADPTRAANELLIYADNEGDIPPNTALMVVTDGANRTEVRITADAKKNGVVIFSKK